MTSFTTELKIDYLDDFVYRLGYYGNDLAGLKNETSFHYLTAKNKGKDMANKIVNQLMHMWTDTNGEHAKCKERIISVARFTTCRITHRLPLEIHRAMLILSFPLIAELTGIASNFDEQVFTPEMAATELKGQYNLADTTLDTAVKKALITMVHVGILKRYRRGLYKFWRWPVFNDIGVYVTLKAAEAFATPEGTNNPYLRGISIQIDKEQVECFSDVNYPVLVGQEVWKDFVSKDNSYTLQYNCGTWTVSNRPYLYHDYNRTKEDIEESLCWGLADIKNETNLERALASVRSSYSKANVQS